MSDLRYTAKAATKTEIPRPKRGEGQWALGYSEPLNKNEQSKKDDNPLNVRARILNIYSKRGFASIDPADLRGRFRWMGLYTQRAPGFDGGKTAMLEEEELDDEFFMMRVRIDGALLSHDAVRALGDDRRRVRPRHRRRHRPREHPVPLDPDRGRPGDLGAARGGRPRHQEACGDSPAAVPRLARSPASPRTRSSTAPRRSRRSSAASSATPTSPTSRASSRPRSPGTPATTSHPRSTTSRSSARCTPSTAPASTCGSAAACRPTRCSPRSSASGSRSTRSPTPGRASRRSSATTATAGCARGPG